MMSSFLALFVLSSFVLTKVDGANNPSPNPDSVVTAGQARFTVLTSRLIRMEWGQTVDTATLTFLNRYLPAPSFQQYDDGQWKNIETDYLTVRLFTCRVKMIGHAHCSDARALLWNSSGVSCHHYPIDLR